MMHKVFKIYLKGMRGDKPGAFRSVKVPVEELNLFDLENTDNINDLNIIYKYGQNDFTLDRTDFCRSASIGDVIEYKGQYFGVMMLGFKQLESSDTEFDPWED